PLTPPTSPSISPPLSAGGARRGCGGGAQGSCGAAPLGLRQRRAIDLRGSSGSARRSCRAPNHPRPRSSCRSAALRRLVSKAKGRGREWSAQRHSPPSTCRKKDSVSGTQWCRGGPLPIADAMELDSPHASADKKGCREVLADVF
ncbi:unnamed protein product, partial [Urochloa humidicola]